jgi:putative peptidoglycan lipid II flippase
MLLRSGVTVALLTLLSRFFGLARELFIASTFGTTAIADCVNVAFKFPNLFRRIFGEGALSSVFIPIFNKKLLESRGSAKRFSGEVFSLLLIVLIILSICMQITMPYLMFGIAPGFYNQSEKFDLAVLLCRITTPYLVFISITAIFGGMTNSIKQFAAFAFTPIIMNLCVIIFTILLKNTLVPELGIAVSLILSGLLQVLFMYICLIRADLQFPFVIKSKDKDVQKLLKNMGPATLSSGAQQLNLFISGSIASFLPGAVSILSYADRLYQLPLSVIGITFGTILLPTLSQIYKQGDFEEANFLQNKAIKIAISLSMPAMFGLIALAWPIIHLIYERGEFTSGDTNDTAYALAAFSFGLPAFVVAKIITPIFYANLDTKTPFKITLYSIAANIALNLVLMISLGYIGIAIGSVIAAWYNTWLLCRYAKMYGDFRITKVTWLFTARVFLSCIIMLAFILWLNHHLGHLFYSEHFFTKLTALMGTIISAISVFLILFFAQKLHQPLFIKYENKI